MIGKLTVYDEAGTTIIAQVDSQSGSEIGVPLVKGTNYIAVIERVGTAAGANDFWFSYNSLGGGNPLEVSNATNDVLTTPEELQMPSGASGYFVEGDISPATDIDHYSIDVAGAATLSIACGAQRSGSGLRNFKIEVLKEDGSAVTGGSIIESATEDAFLKDMAIPASTTKLIVKLTAGSQDPNVTSTYYRCGMYASK